jgi:hypothetical protein
MGFGATQDLEPEALPTAVRPVVQELALKPSRFRFAPDRLLPSRAHSGSRGLETSRLGISPGAASASRIF